MSKIISNKEYEKALNDAENVMVMNKVAAKYKYVLSKDEIHRCKLIALWGALKFWKNGNAKFSSFLYNRVNWECLRTLHEKNQFSYSSIIQNYCKDDKVGDFYSIVEDLPPDLKLVIIQRYVYNMTFNEIGKINNFSHETARRRINDAILYLKKLINK